MRSSLAVKTLRKVNIHTFLDRHHNGYLFVGLCSVAMLRADPPPSVAHHSFTDNGKRFASLGGCYASELFCGKRYDSIAICGTVRCTGRECNSQANDGREGGGGTSKDITSKLHANPRQASQEARGAI